jgi:hypothetical protein
MYPVMHNRRGEDMLSRRVRGFLGVMTTWGVAFSALAVISMTAVILGNPDVPLGFRHLPALALRGFLAGALAGGLFAALVAGRERSGSVSSMSPRRFALWGFVGGASLPVITIAAAGGFAFLPLAAIVTSTLVSGAIGSAIAASTIALARRAPELPAEKVRPGLLEP